MNEAKSLEQSRNSSHKAQDLGSLPEDYESWSARQKQDFLWNKIVKSEYEQLPSLEKIDIVGLFLTSLKTKMERHSDEAPSHWRKAIHAHSSVAKIKFISTADTPFTGLFKGAEYGLIRLSVTGDPAARGFAPGIAIKFLIDGKPSENFSALVSLTGQGENYNFFANEFSNIVPVVKSFGPILTNLIFSRVTKYPTKLYLQDLAESDQHGYRETQPHYPAQVFLVPSPQVQFPEHPPRDFREDLATIAPGIRLFSVYAVDPKKIGDEMIAQLEYRQQAQLIGYIETTSEFVASFYGDRQLFFRHQRFRNK